MTHRPPVSTISPARPVCSPLKTKHCTSQCLYDPTVSTGDLAPGVRSRAAWNRHSAHIHTPDGAARPRQLHLTPLLPLSYPDLTVQSETLSKPRTPYRGTHAGLVL
eukprot:scaffold35090_cov67-Phaeocystis_antarctica.AAC.2